MLCVACGGELSAGSRVCPRCGRVAPAFQGSPPGTHAAAPGSGAEAGGAPLADALATVGQRFGALLLDGFISWLILTVGFIAAAAVASTNLPQATFDNPDPGPTGIAAFVSFVFGALGVLAALAYYSVLEGRPQGHTLGKMALGIRVVRQGNGAPLGYGPAIVRTLGRFLDAITFGIPLGLLWAIWDPQRQTWHDKLAGSVVVRSSVYPPPKTPGAASGYQVTPPADPYRPG